jgi:hypothetical protein
MLPVWSCANALTAISERHRVATIARILELGHRFIAAPFSIGTCLGALPNVQITAQMPGSTKLSGFKELHDAPRFGGPRRIQTTVVCRPFYGLGLGTIADSLANFRQQK